MRRFGAWMETRPALGFPLVVLFLLALDLALRSVLGHGHPVPWYDVAIGTTGGSVLAVPVYFVKPGAREGRLAPARTRWLLIAVLALVVGSFALVTRHAPDPGALRVHAAR